MVVFVEIQVDLSPQLNIVELQQVFVIMHSVESVPQNTPIVQPVIRHIMQEEIANLEFAQVVPVNQLQLILLLLPQQLQFFMKEQHALDHIHTAIHRWIVLEECAKNGLQVVLEAIATLSLIVHQETSVLADNAQLKLEPPLVHLALLILLATPNSQQLDIAFVMHQEHQLEFVDH